MRRQFCLIAAILVILHAAGCGSNGRSADAPTNVVAVPGDGIVTVTWAMTPGVEYWLFYGNTNNITSSNWTSILGVRSVLGATSPFVATGLGNGSVYSFMIDGRINGGPGGGDSPSISAIPRLAGTATAALPLPWTAGAALGAFDLRGVTYGTRFAAVGAGGVAYSSADGTTWTASNSGVLSNLNAASYRGVYLAVGDGGAMTTSSDATTWTSRTSGTANNLYAVATNTGVFIAVGANGTILGSQDGVTWAAAANSATTNDLYAVTSYGSGLWIATGANGTVVTSTDGNTWTARTSNTALDLRGVAFGTNATTGALTFAAVGANGTLITSPDGLVWTAQPAIGPGNLSAVNFGTQWVAVGASGSIFTSRDGTTWVVQPSATISNLSAIAHAPYGYSVVGAVGTNLLAK